MAKEFKRSSKDSTDKGSEPKKGKDSKKGKKPVFERFRDDSRPSDFGSASQRRTSSFDDKKRKPFGDKPAFRKKRGDDDAADEKPRYSDEKPASRKRPSSDDRERNSEERPSFKKESPSYSKEKPSYNKEKPSFSKEKPSRSGDSKRKPFGDKPAFGKKRSDDRKGDTERPASRKNHDDGFYESKPSFVRESDKKDFDYEAEYEAKKRGVPVKREEPAGEKPRKKREESTEGRRSPGSESENYSRPYKKRAFDKKPFPKKPAAEKMGSGDGTTRLNKYIANAGICSRREADELIESGVVQVNGKIITEMGFKVKPTDVIKYGGQTLKKEKHVYLILNKPKDYITTVDDPQQRKTVLELIQGACRERLYPVGRLDRATTGLLMFTNDGELTKKLTHPRYGVRKVYHVELDKPLKRTDLDKIAEGIELEDGPVKVDEVSYVGDGKDKANVGVEIHSGKNRIVRRIFEHLGYNVRKLDRVVFGPLTKKDMPRGRWRMLTEAEIGMMKMISSGGD
jgi:23S rRNA pseudouridine2605 synthase